MKEDVKDLWVAALRSGKYEQGTEQLCHNGRHCCLGVLCEIMGAEKVYFEGTVLYDGLEDILPVGVQVLSGLRTRRGDLHGKCLTSINDSGHSFEDIAQIIEKEWQQL